jgi:hypothetical protein
MAFSGESRQTKESRSTADLKRMLDDALGRHTKYRSPFGGFKGYPEL